MQTPIIDFDESSYRLDKPFSEYLEGKTVAVVGRGGLDDLEQGEFIDSHDVVARVHDMAPYEDGFLDSGLASGGRGIMTVPEKWHSRIGKKCHISYYRHTSHDDSAKSRDYVKNQVKGFYENGGVFLCVECWRGHTLRCELIWQSEYDVRYCRLDHFLNTMRAIGGVSPYAGTLAVTDILRHNVKSLYITGMPFWITETNSEDPIKSVNHEPLSDLAFIAGLAEQYPDRVTIDSNIQKAWKIANETHFFISRI